MSRISIFWFRRDLSIEDNAGLYYALCENHPVLPVFIFDTEILSKLPNKKDARVQYIHQEIKRLAQEFSSKGTTLDIRIGSPLEVWKQLVREYDIATVFANRDYEPYARERDKQVFELLKSREISFRAKKNQVIFEKDEVLKKDGKPYTVFTPYSRVWKEKLNDFYLKSYPSEKIDNWLSKEPKPVPSLQEIGFEETEIEFPKKDANKSLISNYHNTRDVPAVRGTSRLSLHLRFGTISIRTLVRETMELNASYLNELIWREFYQSILWHFPHVVTDNFKKKYDGVEWRNNEEDFKRWRKGKTGFPMVDAGMRELNETGFMHNRVRMITAGFLTKHLLIDWRWGEAYFAEKLLDFELASNNGGWQWAAGTGTDAAPYFRIFNPYSQADKFDPDKAYIRKWVPEFGTPDYPEPMVDHSLARQRAIDTYKQALDQLVE